MISGRSRAAVGFFAACAFVSIGTSGAYAGVTSATLAVDHATYAGPCPVTLSFTGVISGSPSTTFSWQWNRGSGTDPVVHHVTLDATGRVSVAETIVQSVSGSGWEQLWVHGILGGQPDVYSSPRTSYSVSCVAPTPSHAPLVAAPILRSAHAGIAGPTSAPGGTVRSVSISADTPLYAGPCPVWVNFSARANGTPSASFRYGWNANFGISRGGLGGSLDSAGAGSFDNRIGFSTSSAGWYQFWVFGDGAAQPDVFSTRMYYGVTCTSTAPIGVAVTPTGHTLRCAEGCAPAPVNVDPTSQSFAYVTSQDERACPARPPMDPLLTTFPAGLAPVGFAYQERGGAHGCHRDIVYRAFATFDLRYHIVVRPVHKVYLFGVTSGVDADGGPCSIDVYKASSAAHGYLRARSDFPSGTLIGHVASALSPVLDITSAVLLPPPAVPGSLDPNVTFMLVGGDETFAIDQRRCVIPLRLSVIIQNE